MKSIILAGGRLDPVLAQQTGLAWRSELPFKGRTFLEIVREALPGDIIVVGGAHADIPAGERFIESFARGVEAGGSGRFLMASADLPFLNKACVEGFIAHDDRESAIIYPIVELQKMDTKYPGMARTSLRLKEGEFTGGNLFLVDGEAMKSILPRMQKAYEARKNVLKLGQLLGFPTLLTLVKAKALPGSVSVSTLELRVGRALQTKVRAVISDYPELAADIDTLEHFAWLQSL